MFLAFGRSVGSGAPGRSSGRRRRGSWAVASSQLHRPVVAANGSTWLGGSGDSGEMISGSMLDEEWDEVADRALHLCVGRSDSSLHHLTTDLGETVSQPLLNLGDGCGFRCLVHEDMVSALVGGSNPAHCGGFPAATSPRRTTAQPRHRDRCRRAVRIATVPAGNSAAADGGNREAPLDQFLPPPLLNEGQLPRAAQHLAVAERHRTSDGARVPFCCGIQPPVWLVNIRSRALSSWGMRP